MVSINKISVSPISAYKNTNTLKPNNTPVFFGRKNTEQDEFVLKNPIRNYQYARMKKQAAAELEKFQNTISVAKRIGENANQTYKYANLLLQESDDEIAKSDMYMPIHQDKIRTCDFLEGNGEESSLIEIADNRTSKSYAIRTNGDMWNKVTRHEDGSITLAKRVCKKDHNTITAGQIYHFDAEGNLTEYLKNHTIKTNGFQAVSSKTDMQINYLIGNSPYEIKTSITSNKNQSNMKRLIRIDGKGEANAIRHDLVQDKNTTRAKHEYAYSSGKFAAFNKNVTKTNSNFFDSKVKFNAYYDAINIDFEK